jgi:hypothetical protein
MSGRGNLAAFLNQTFDGLRLQEVDLDEIDLSRIPDIQSVDLGDDEDDEDDVQTLKENVLPEHPQTEPIELPELKLDEQPSDELIEQFPEELATKREPRKTMAPMTGKRVSDEYTGEHDRAGWRAKNEEDKKLDQLTTKSYTEEEIEKNKVELGKDGVVKIGGKTKDEYGEERDGTDYSSFEDLKVGYVMDPSGKMVAFDDGMEVSGTDKNGKTPSSEEVNEMIKQYGGLIKVLKDNPDLKVQFRHHSSALGSEEGLDGEGTPVKRSKEAASAGFIELDREDKIKSISNESGHYKPSVAHLMQAVEHLAKQGAFLNGDLYKFNNKGEPEELDKNSKEGRLYEALRPKLEQVPQMQKRAAELGKASGEDSDDGEAKEELKEIVAELEKIARASDMLRKLGVGPSQKQTDAQAKFIEPKKGQTGPQVRGLETTEMDVEEFLSSGGGYTSKKGKQKDLKETMLEELKRTVQEKGGTETSPRLPPSEKQLDEILQEFPEAEEKEDLFAGAEEDDP